MVQISSTCTYNLNLTYIWHFHSYSVHNKNKEKGLTVLKNLKLQERKGIYGKMWALIKPCTVWQIQKEAPNRLKHARVPYKKYLYYTVKIVQIYWFFTLWVIEHLSKITSQQKIILFIIRIMYRAGDVIQW